MMQQPRRPAKARAPRKLLYLRRFPLNAQAETSARKAAQAAFLFDPLLLLPA
jgi:hypothetical protein